MSRSAFLRTKTGRRVGKGLLALTGLAFALLVVEIGVRVVGDAAEQKRIDDWERVQTGNIEKANAAGEVFLGEIVGPSRHPEVAYQLMPNVDVLWETNARVKMCSRGHRGPEFSLEKPAGVHRIVTIGDSFMFGLGVDQNTCTVRVMERRMREKHGLKVEVINMAVPGFNTAMEVAYFAAQGLAYDPDLVIIDFVGNDFQLPFFLSARKDFWVWNRSFLYEWLAGSEGDVTVKDPLHNPTALELPEDREGSATDMSKVPEEFRWMVGEDGYRRALRRLRDLAVEHGFPVVMTVHYDTRDVVAEMANECGFHLMYGFDAIWKYQKEQGIESVDDYMKSKLVVSPSNLHPSVLAHKIVGEYYADRLVDDWAKIWASRKK